MRYIELFITRSENLKIAASFPSWEIPILQHVHGLESVEVTGEIDALRPWPQDAAAEYDRLAQRYGKVEGTDQTIVSLIYGQGMNGMQQLARAMAQAKREADLNPIDYVAKEAAAVKASGPKVVVPYEGVTVDTTGLDRETANAVVEAANLAS